MTGLFRGARRYEIIRDKVKNEEVNIFVGTDVFLTNILVFENV